jgi:hypothetical protein
LDADSAGFVSPVPGVELATSGPNPAAGAQPCGPEVPAEQPDGLDYTELTIVFNPPSNTSGLKLSFNFFTAETPDYRCEFNDRFYAYLNGTNIAMDALTNAISAATSVLGTNAADLNGTGFTDGATTGWIHCEAPVLADTTNTLRLILFDGTDRTMDSTILIDAFQWISVPIPPPELQISKAVALRWASVSNAVYQVKWASQLDTNLWFDLGGAVIGNGTTNVVYDDAEADLRLYRVEVP